jgi:anti-sigma factor RsiW
MTMTMRMRMMVGMWRRSNREAMAACREVGRVLQPYLDGQVDEVTARRVNEHLEACRRCGLEANVYEELKAALARRATDVDPTVVERVQSFGRDLVDSPPSEAAGPPTG